jgi:glycosyltransferase involved in cell wall biosynthesis
MARVSVVMAVYNAAKYLRESVDSILSQTFRDLELIVVNDASTDASAEILQAFDDPRIRVITHATNQGAAASRNDALAAARGDFVAIMDADDISAPSRLEVQVSFLDSHPDVALVGCAVYDNIDDQGSTLHTSHLPEDNDAIQRTLVERWCFLHPSIMFRKEVYEQVGGYRNEFEPAEDHDFILRVLDRHKAHNLPVKLVRYRINPKGLSVVGHDYIDAFGFAAMRLARQRREGRGEDLSRELNTLMELKYKRKTLGFWCRAITAWRDSYYASRRYYGFGCRELCAGNLKEARKCFARSLGANYLFVKSWICLPLSLFPFLVERARFAFPASLRHNDELAKHGSRLVERDRAQLPQSAD